MIFKHTFESIGEVIFDRVGDDLNAKLHQKSRFTRLNGISKEFPYWLCALFTPLTLLATTLQLQSDRAQYSINQVDLSGHVIIDHPLGHLLCNSAKVTTDQGALCHLQLEQEAHLTFLDGHSLECERASIDFVINQGYFWGEIKPVCLIKDQKNQMPLTIQAPYIELDFEAVNPTSWSSYSIQTASAFQGVNVQWGPFYTAQADHLIFTSTDNTSQTRLYPGAATPCSLHHTHLGVIEATLIDINHETQKITCLESQGLLQRANSLDSLKFECGQLCWCNVEQSLQLKENVIVTQPNFLLLKSDGQVNISYDPQNCYQIKVIEAEGFNEIQSFQQPGNDYPFTITCLGHIVVEQSQLQAILTPEPLEQKQVEYQDNRLRICGNKARILYSYREGKPFFSTIEMSGEVKVIEWDCAGLAHRYAFADQLCFYPAENKAHLYSEQSQKVFFVDSSYKKQMCADELFLWRDAQKKPCLKAMGKVRMIFSQNELLQIKELIFNCGGCPL